MSPIHAGSAHRLSVYYLTAPLTSHLTQLKASAGVKLSGQGTYPEQPERPRSSQHTHAWTLAGALLQAE